ncbi:MAG: type I restriction enzyme HsdR N-terminal domain-containing protein [Cyclobacteriaceae bacterium]
MFAKLNLPEFDYRVKHIDGKPAIFDLLRRKFVILTPEEWVRQHFIHFLINERNFPKGLFRVEKSLNYNRLSKRADIIVCNRSGDPILLVECKSARQKINQAAFDQAATYNKKIGATTSVITNGLRHFCFQTDFSTHQVNFIPNIPFFEELLSN